MKMCYIIGAAPAELDFSPEEGDLVIAADGGYDTLIRCGITPNVVLGDMDSIKADISGIEIIKFPPEKDDTDTALAVKYGRNRGYTAFTFYGCAGGSFDHTLANTAHLKALAEAGCQGLLAGGGWAVTAIKDRALRFSQKAAGRISIFSMTDSAWGVSLKGLKYPLENVTLTSSVPLGVSNEFLGVESSVIAKKGVLCIYSSMENLTNMSNLFDSGRK